MTKVYCLLGCDAVYFHAKFYVFKEPFPSVFRVQEGRQQVPGKGWQLSTKPHAVTIHNLYSHLWRSVKLWGVALTLYCFIATGCCNSPELQQIVDAACLRKIDDTVGRNIRTRFAFGFPFHLGQSKGTISNIVTGNPFHIPPIHYTAIILLFDPVVWAAENLRTNTLYKSHGSLLSDILNAHFNLLSYIFLNTLFLDICRWV
jgi:hypothetical protein